MFSEPQAELPRKPLLSTKLSNCCILNIKSQKQPEKKSYYSKENSDKNNVSLFIRNNGS